ncbi:hypothetical protein R80B4_03272 [Fibrobacteres bacterium R8-0-B4]
MRRTNVIGKVLSVGLLVAALTVIGCGGDDGNDGGNDEGIWLAGLSNPFLGRWEFRPISAGGTLVQFNFKTDGTYECEMPEMMPGFIMIGGYLVNGNKQVSFLSYDEGIGGYEFTVNDNNTIMVTEIDAVDDDGRITYGNTLPFTRIEGSPVNKENKPFALSNLLIGGTWKETVTPYQAEYTYKADGTGTMSYTGGGTSAIAYSAFHDEGIDKDVLIVYMTATKTFASYAFDRIEGAEEAISVQEITEVTMGAEGLSVDYGPAVTFTRNR